MTSLRYIWARAFKKAQGRALAGSTIDPTSKIEANSTVVDSTMDRHSFCGYDCTILHADVGAFVSIANRVTIGAGGRHPLHFTSMSPVFLDHRDSVKTKFANHHFEAEARTVVGSDVWIGEAALIRSGVTIGHGSVVGMGSVVTRDVEPYAIVGGNPARIIRQRFDERTVKALLASAWWTWPDERLREAGPLIPDPVALMRREGFL